ncbi:MAG: ABC transporter permease [Actinomycetota bacterium]
MSVATEVMTPQTRPYHEATEFFRAIWYVGAREIRNLIRTPAAFIPSFFIPLFFFFVQSGSLAGLVQRSGAIGDYKAFILPVAILFSVSNEGAGFNMVQDIERGYFDKVMLVPANRLGFLIGTVGANFMSVVFRSLIVTGVAMAAGLHFKTGIAGVLPMVLIASLWGLVFAGVGLTTAIKTGNAQAVQGTIVFLFPLLFLTTSFAPRAQMTGWLKTAVIYNPITYILDAMRSFSVYGLQWGTIGKGLLALAILAPITMGMAIRALHSRLK